MNNFADLGLEEVADFGPWWSGRPRPLDNTVDRGSHNITDLGLDEVIDLGS